MEYNIQLIPDHIAVIRLKGRIIGEFQVVELNEEIEELIEQDIRHVIFNLSELEFMSSAGLSFFLKTLTRVRHNDGEVVLAGVNRLLSELLVTTKLQSFFVIEPGEDEALAYLRETDTIQ